MTSHNQDPPIHVTQTHNTYNQKFESRKICWLICVSAAAPGASQGHPGTLQGHPGRPAMRSSHSAFPFEAHMEYCLQILRHHPNPLRRRYCGGC